ncbi:MAG: CheR family methyltransferase [Dehalococcoidales bacterium]
MMNQEEFTFLKKKIREFTKFDLDNYGRNQMMRRLDGFLNRAKVGSVAHYCKLLEKDPEERKKLQDFLTINVSEFYRDMPHFKMLQEEILPPMLQHTPALNIWSAGCSNGAEVYSVAIILDRLAPYTKHRILATDIDENILNMAMAGGPYKASDIRNISKDQVDKYFNMEEDVFWIKDSIRKKVVFKQQDLTRDSFEENFDLIICRNVVIYFSDETKKKLRRRFLEALKDNGILFIGATETMLDAGDLHFRRISPCFYQKIGDSVEKKIHEAVSVK